MIIKTLELTNFRQFLGSQRLTFAVPPEQNVTVVYGANGAGKTTLLNAFTWALYGSFSPGFERPDSLINEFAWDKAKLGHEVEAGVLLEFEHEGRHYTVHRTIVDRKEDDGSATRVHPESVSVEFIDEDGESHNRDEASRGTLNEVLPERLHRFFFFDGERIENLVKPDAYAEIEQAIKGILGLQVVERAIKHTNEARKDLERELRDLGDDEDRVIADRLEDLRTQRDEREQALEQTRQNVAALEQDRRNVGDRLAQLAEAAAQQKEREELESDLSEVDEALKATSTSLANALARKGWLAFIPDVAKKTISIFEERRERGEIPADLKRQFVEDLLERRACICGSELEPGSNAYELVADWRDRAVEADVEEAWTSLPTRAEGVMDRRRELYEYLHETLKERQRHRENRKRIIDKLSSISDSLKHGESNTVTELERSREQIDVTLVDETRSLARLEVEIERMTDREGELEEELERARAENERAELARRRVAVARHAADTFREILRLRTEEVREQLDQRIKGVYSQISFKPYVPILDESFRLDLRSSDGNRSPSIAKSTGENQILSLSFVGALAEHARDRYNDAKKDPVGMTLSFQGGIYPIVMDSPFGSLDVNYQESVASAIPRLAPQVIVFVSKSQGLGAVQQQMKSNIGKEYVINFLTPKPGIEEETLSLKAHTFPYISRTNDDERAEILEVTES